MATALQRIRAIHLYRHGLKNMLSWAVRREVFYVEVRAHLRPGQAVAASMSTATGRRQAKGRSGLSLVPHTHVACCHSLCCSKRRCGQSSSSTRRW